MLLNFCFHTALTFAVFAGGINQIKYPIICQAVSAFPFHSFHSQSFFGKLIVNVCAGVGNQGPEVEYVDMSKPSVMGLCASGHSFSFVLTQ